MTTASQPECSNLVALFEQEDNDEKMSRGTTAAQSLKSIANVRLP